MAGTEQPDVGGEVPPMAPIDGGAPSPPLAPPPAFTPGVSAGVGPPWAGEPEAPPTRRRVWPWVLGVFGAGLAVLVGVVVIALVVVGQEWPPTGPTELEWTEADGPQCANAEQSSGSSLVFEHLRTTVPAGGWDVVKCDDTGDALFFAARAAQELFPKHTYVVELREQHVTPEDASMFRGTGEDGPSFRDAIQSRLEEPTEGFAHPAARVELVPALPGTDLCAEGDFRVMDQRVPGNEGESWPMRVRSLTCLSAASAQPTLTSLSWSERAPTSEDLTPLDELGPWLDPFLGDAEFTTDPTTTTTTSTAPPLQSTGSLGTDPELTGDVEGPQCESAAAGTGPGVAFDHVATMLPDGSWTLVWCYEEDGWIDFSALTGDEDVILGLVTEHLSPGELSRLRSLGGSESWGNATEETLRDVFSDWIDMQVTVSPAPVRPGADGCVGFTLDATDVSVPDEPWPYGAVGEVCRVLDGDQQATIILFVEQSEPTDTEFLPVEELRARFGTWWGSASFSG